MQEMIVDVHRLQKKKNKKSIETTSNNYLVDSAEEDDDLFVSFNIFDYVCSWTRNFENHIDWSYVKIRWKLGEWI